jgi:hypothetical protein
MKVIGISMTPFECAESGMRTVTVELTRRAKMKAAEMKTVL